MGSALHHSGCDHRKHVRTAQFCPGLDEPKPELVEPTSIWIGVLWHFQGLGICQDDSGVTVRAKHVVAKSTELNAPPEDTYIPATSFPLRLVMRSSPASCSEVLGSRDLSRARGDICCHTSEVAVGPFRGGDSQTPFLEAAPGLAEKGGIARARNVERHVKLGEGQIVEIANTDRVVARTD